MQQPGELAEYYRNMRAAREGVYKAGFEGGWGDKVLVGRCGTEVSKIYIIARCDSTSAW